MSSIFSAPYDAGLFRKHAAFYVAIQIIIWIKVAVFYSLYGRGYFVAGVLAPLLAPQLLTVPHMLFDYVFHQAMHLLIFVALLLFARRVVKPNILQLIFFFAVAVFLHNVGYWFTNAFDSLAEIISDAVFDFVILFVLFYLVHWLAGIKMLSWIVNYSKNK